MDLDADQLREAVEHTTGAKATLVQAVPVREAFDGQPVWEGVVHVFDLEGSELASRAYAWSTVIDEKTQRRRFYTVLHRPPVTSPLEAVRASIVADHKGATG